MINIDFLAAGCNTRCKHCYVNGGPGPVMPLEDALLCLEKLDAIAAHLPGEVNFTLDHEPINHPQLKQILHAAARTRHISHYHHGMTTGAGWMSRNDRETLIRAYQDCGCNIFGITLHGGAAGHDEIVRRKGAYELALAAARFLKAQGVKLKVSLMLNRFFAQDAEDISAVLEQLQPDAVWFALPLFTPHKNMMDFEAYRATVGTLEHLRGYLTEWRQDEEKILSTARQNTPASAARRLKDVSLRALFAAPQEEMYLTLHADCRLYVGNSGVETQCLGDLRSLNPEPTARLIASLPGNRDYTAFYDVDALPPDETLQKALEALPPDMVYGDFESALYRGLTELCTPTKLLF